VSLCRLEETVSNLGLVRVTLITADRGSGMKWRVMVELTGNDGIVRSHEVSAGGSNKRMLGWNGWSDAGGRKPEGSNDVEEHGKAKQNPSG
jgi:hypothetical protein